MKRRKFILNSALTVLGASSQVKVNSAIVNIPYSSQSSPEIVVIGAGVFGVWTAFYLQELGAKVTLIDAYGPGNSRASSGGESRILRSDYGEKMMYSRMNIRAHELWSKWQEEWGHTFMYSSGRLTFYMNEAKERIKATQNRLSSLGVKSEFLDSDELQYRWPQINSKGIDFAAYYPGGNGGSSLMAREACRIVGEQFQKKGGKIVIAKATIKNKNKTYSIITNNGEEIKADKYIFACGPWMGKVFPELFTQRLKVYRRDVFFVGPAAGDNRYSHPNMPIWSFNNPEDARFYGMPDLRGRGVKIAPFPDLNTIDMDYDDRVNNPIEIKRTRAFIKRRFPGLIGQPILEGRVCQLTYSSDSDFIIDQHPEDDRIWFACAGSGHAFKHGPALGEYISNRILLNKKLPEYDNAFRLK